jgi:hypothetical protein
MKITIDGITIHLESGLRLMVQPDGVVRVQATAKPAAAASAGKPDPRPASWWDDTAPNGMATRPPGRTRTNTADQEVRQNHILKTLLDQPDPYAWLDFRQLLHLAYPTLHHRNGGRATIEYSRVQWSVRYLVESHELDMRRDGTGRGRGARMRYRLHKPDAAVAPGASLNAEAVVTH